MNPKITLIPGLSAPGLKLKLQGLLDKCICFRGCTAFWTIPIDFFPARELAVALKRKGSFFCADIQSPTNISNIKEYHKFGTTNIYLHHYKLAVKDKKTAHLLHSKILVFDMSETTAEIWIGSHNMTGRAVKGLNLEASVAIKCKKTDEIYIDTYEYLKKLKKNFCIKFNPKHVDIYLKLQQDKDKNAGDIAETLELVGEDMDNLEDEKIIQLLSGNTVEFSKYKKIGTIIYLHAYDINTKKEYFYECMIEQAGNLGQNNKLELNFVQERRFANIQTGTNMPYPLLYPQTKINDEILNDCKYFVNISIARKAAIFEVCKKPSKADLSFWQKPDTNKNPYSIRQDDFGHTDTLDIDENNNCNFDILEATFDDNVKTIQIHLKEEWEKLDLDEKYKNHLRRFKGYFGGNKYQNAFVTDIEYKEALDYSFWYDYKNWYENEAEKRKIDLIKEDRQDIKSAPSLKERIIVVIYIVPENP